MRCHIKLFGNKTAGIYFSRLKLERNTNKDDIELNRTTYTKMRDYVARAPQNFADSIERASQLDSYKNVHTREVIIIQ